MVDRTVSTLKVSKCHFQTLCAKKRIALEILTISYCVIVSSCRFLNQEKDRSRIQVLTLKYFQRVLFIVLIRAGLQDEIVKVHIGFYVKFFHFIQHDKTPLHVIAGGNRFRTRLLIASNEPYVILYRHIYYYTTYLQQPK